MKLLGITGSLRAASVNTKLLRIAARAFEASQFDIADLNMPLYNGDVEAAEGIPAPAQLLFHQIASADAVIVATPEYNKGIPGNLKNAFDWVSRVKGNPWKGKPVAIMSATAGRTGGDRAQAELRLALQPFAPMILQGPEVMVAAANSAFENDTLSDARYADKMDILMSDLKSLATAKGV